MSAYFITSTGTEIGKTYLTCGLIDRLRGRGAVIDAIKPVLSGFEPEQAGDSDSGLILRALGRGVVAQHLDAISPWRFRAALSPDMAAEREGRAVALDEVRAFCTNAIARLDVILIEGAGGVMSPLGRGFTNLDLIAALDVRVLLVVGTYLGTISHTLTACAALAQRGRAPWAIVLSESLESPVPPAETATSMKRFASAPIYLMARGGGAPSALVEAMLRV